MTSTPDPRHSPTDSWERTMRRLRRRAAVLLAVLAASAVGCAAATGAAAETTVRVTYAAGRVTGDDGKAPIALGHVVHIVVSSDVADEVHLHGYDRSVQVPAGGTATLSVTADIPGGFEVELEKLGQHLLELQVG